jgi:mannose-6-phosphate isomerase-like protein (cupin superfamily)
MTTDNKTAARHEPLPASLQHVVRDHSGSSGRALLSGHRPSARTVNYLRCYCGVWLVLQEGERLAEVAPPPPHIHRREDETFYLVEGERRLVLADE